MLIRIAQIPFEVTELSPELERRMADFGTDEAPEFSITIQPEDIQREWVEYERADRRMNRKNSVRTDLLMVFIAIHRKLVEKAPFYGAFTFHGSAIAVDGQAYIFSALSGTGKSTHTRLWREMLGERAVMVNDDKPMLRVTDEATYACGTPWNGKHKIGNNIQVPVRAICLLERSPDNWIHEISKHEAYPELLRQIFKPEDPAAMAKVMELLGKMKVKFYRMGCNMDPEAARVAYEGMSGNGSC